MDNAQYFAQAFVPGCDASAVGTAVWTHSDYATGTSFTTSEPPGFSGDASLGNLGVVSGPDSDNMATWPPGLSAPPEIPGASPVSFDTRPYISPTESLKRFLRGADICRAASSLPLAATTGAAVGVTGKAVLLSVGLAHAAVFAPVVAPAAIVAGAIAGAATAWSMGVGPARRLIRAQVRHWFFKAGGGTDGHGYTDPGFAARDGAVDEEADLPSTVANTVAGGGEKVRVKRVRHFAPYANGKIRGAYICSLVAEVRTQYAGRARDSTTEHAARRALVTRMRDHGMRATDIDRVREHCVNAVFFITEDDEVAADVRRFGERWGIQRGAGGPV